MSNFLTYVKHSYEVILEAEAKLCVNLEHETEAYVVHLFARYMDKPNINQDPICIKMMQSTQLSKIQKRTTYLLFFFIFILIFLNKLSSFNF